MTEPLGWIGFLLFVSTLVPFFTRRFKSGQPGVFTRNHHTLALASLAMLFIHGISALLGRHGWQWGKLFHGSILTGVTSWLVMLAVVILAVLSARQKLYRRTHCRLVILLVVTILFHVS